MTGSDDKTRGSLFDAIRDRSRVVSTETSAAVPQGLRIATAYAWRFLVLAAAIGVAVWLVIQLKLLVIPLLWLGYHSLGRQAVGAVRNRPPLGAGGLTTLLGGLFLLLLNDTGVMAWALATGCALLFCLDLLLMDGEASASSTGRAT